MAPVQAQPEATTHTLNITIDRVVAHTLSAVVFSHGELELNQGPQLILLRNLSSPPGANQSLEEKSLQVNLEGGGALVERIVWDHVPLATEDELKSIQDEIQSVSGDRILVREKIKVLESHLTTLQKFGNSLVSPSSELVKQGDTIVQILSDAHEAQIEVGGKIHELRQQERDLDTQLQELQSNWEQSAVPQRVAKVYISVEEKAVVVLHLQQIVTSVTWRPHYEIHVSSTTGFVNMTYHALVHQRTAHTWTNVSMELCTGAPSTDRKLPSLTPWYIIASKKQSRSARETEGYSKKRKSSVVRTQYSLQVATAGADDDDDDEGGAEEVHLDKTDESMGSSSSQSEVISSGVSDVFVLPKRQTIPPSHDIRVHIATINLKANLTYTAVPKKSSKVYVQALIINNSPFTLLPGSSIVFVDGSFVGSSQVNLIPIGGQAFLDIGIDDGLSVLKKGVLAETKSTGVMWGRTKTTEFQYDLVLRSMRSFGVTVHVKDQVPLPQSEGLKVVVSRPDIGEVRADHKPAAIDTNITLRAGGEIVWERYLPPDSVQSIRLHYSMEVDSDLYIHDFDVHNFEL